MADNQNVLLPLQLHDNRLHPLDQVLVGLQSGRGGGLLLFIYLMVVKNNLLSDSCVSTQILSQLQSKWWRNFLNDAFSTLDYFATY